MPALARDFEVISVDQRGIGLSDKPQDGYDSGTLAGEMSVWPGARHRALGKLDPRPDVHVDHDADDLEDLLRAEVLGERVWKRWKASSRSVSAARVSASV